MPVSWVYQTDFYKHAGKLEDKTMAKRPEVHDALEDIKK